MREISIHAAREGGDCKLGTFGQNAPIFQSTPPVKAATYASTEGCHAGKISIHAAREGGDYYSWQFLPDTGISIHAAREGGDGICPDCYRKIKEISIHAAREGGDGYARASANAAGISIHAAREGGDRRCNSGTDRTPYFNPRRP